MKKIIAAGALALAVVVAGCASPADVASQNISTDAELFKVDRRIVGINLISDKYLFVATGKCSIENPVGSLEITCKVGENAYQKHFVGVPQGANVTYTVEQLETSNVSDYSYSFIFRPETIVPTLVR